MSADVREIKNCLCCGGRNLSKYLDLHDQPLANNLKADIQTQDTVYPLAVNLCHNCYHSQLTVSVDKKLLFSNYLYVSGTSRSLKDYFEKLAVRIVGDSGCKKCTILDIACNDGTFLDCFKKYGWDIYGVDPAMNLRTLALAKGVKLYTDYFPIRLNRKFDVITALNVLAHTDTPLEFLKGCHSLLEDNGRLYVQTSQKDMAINAEIDTVYHEHQSYFNISSMQALARRAGLWLESAEAVNVHGNSYLFVLRKTECSPVELEKDARYSLYTYLGMQQRAEDMRIEFGRVTGKLKVPLVGYGAAAKGVVLLNFIRVPIDYVVDDNPMKQGKFIPGVNVPIVTSGHLKNDSRQLGIIVFAWNMFDDIKENIERLGRKDDYFIVPFPKIRAWRKE